MPAEHQSSKKASQPPYNKVQQKIKDKKIDKISGQGLVPLGRNHQRGKVSTHSETLSEEGSGGSFGTSERKTATGA